MDLIATVVMVSVGAVLVSVATALLLRPHLRRLLDELCGSRERASFWVAISTVVVVLTGLLAGTATVGYPDAGSTTAHDLAWGALTQVRYLLVGLVGILVVIAAVLLRAVARFEARAERDRYYRSISHAQAPSASVPTTGSQA